MAGDVTPRPVFEVSDGAPAGSGQDLLGLWTPVPLPPAEAIAFGTGAGTMDVAPVWRANYPEDPDLAEAHLEGARQSLEAAEAALARTPDRLDAFVAQERAGLAFAIPSPGTPPDRAEDDLSLLLRGIQGGVPVASYGLADRLAGGWEEAVQTFQDFTARLQQLVSRYAWVETRVEDRLVGQTAVTWTGDVDTILLDWLGPDQLQLHQQTLSLALASRRNMLRTSALVITSAVKLSALLATPGGIVLALPAVLRFINQIRVELNRE